MSRMSRVPRWAEKMFSAACSLYGAVASQPDEDINGWDLLVEFPALEQSSDSEFAPPRRKAFVQIKSTKNHNLSVAVKLSNMLTACSSADPWFIFLITSEGIIHGKHISGELMASSLKKVRQARLTGKKLHKESLTITFGNADVLEENVAAWMQDRILANAHEYSSSKRDQYETLGYEDGWGSGKFTVVTDREEAIAEAFLGLGNGVQVEQVSFVHERFGLPEPMASPLGPGRIFIDPSAIDSCEIRIRGKTRDSALSLPGKVYGFSPPQAAADRHRFRFSAPPIELVVGPSAGRGLLALNSKQDRDLHYFETYARICRWMRDGPVNLEVRRRGKLAYKSEMHCDTSGPIFSTMLTVIDGLSSIARHSATSSARLSLEDLSAALPLVYDVAQLVTSASVRVEAPEASFTESSYTSILYPFCVDVGRWTFMGLVNRQTLRDRPKNGLREITAGPPSLLDVSIIEDADQTEKEAIQEDLLRAEAEMEQSGMPLTVANMMEWLQETRQQKLDQRAEL